MEKKKILIELTRDVHMPIFCDEEGRCDAINDCATIDANECSCCDINHIVRAFNRGIEFQKQKSTWISVKDDLPCNHDNLLESNYSIQTHKVLVAYNNGKYYGFARMNKIIGIWEWYDRSDDITHWMPIPKMTKEE